MYNEIKAAHRDVENIFREVLPKYGMNEREEQIQLCHMVLDTLWERRIGLCDAGTGIGKTYAYLVACVLFDRICKKQNRASQPIVLSTASIALQEALQNEYIPFLSNALCASGYLEQSIHSVVRKGKGHYVCTKRLQSRLKRIHVEKKNRKNLYALLSLQMELDMDGVKGLSQYDRHQVQVPKICDCNKMTCQYKRFVADSNSTRYLFQICNHNLLLADVLHREKQLRPILPDYSAIVLDEAHKLPEAAKQMFGKTLPQEEMRSLVKGLRIEKFVWAAQKAMTVFEPIIKEMGIDKDTKTLEETLNGELKKAVRTMEMIKKKFIGGLSKPLESQFNRILEALTAFTKKDKDDVLYVGMDEKQQPMLCVESSDTSEQMKRVLWKMRTPILLTSGTLSVGKDFSYFKQQTGMDKDKRIWEKVFASPFLYEKNCLLYMPRTTVYYQGNDVSRYYAETAREIAELLKISNGHALVLFNSYAAMSAIRVRLNQYGLQYPIYVMSRNNAHIAGQFKRSRNGILLATGAAWEGMDFPGNIVSMLIIPRLPFAAPDALREKQKEACGSLKTFIRQIAVPEMQRKLRQGFGRAIRLETDTCAIAILDARASKKGRYREAVMQALPPIKCTEDIEEVRRFFLERKSKEYWKEGMENEQSN